MDATSLALIMAGLANGAGVCHAPEECCAQCQAFWRHVHEVLVALEDEVQEVHARVAGVRQAILGLVGPAEFAAG